jgi:hypothetical protein
MKRFVMTLIGLSAVSAVLAIAQPSGKQPTPQAGGGKTYTLFVYEDAKSFERRSDAAHGAEYWGAFAAYGQELAQAGVLRGGSAVHPIAEGRVVSVRGTKTKAEAIAPDARGLEVGGSFVIEVADMDAAIAWAAKCPAATTGQIVIRENVPMGASMMERDAKDGSAPARSAP